MSRLQHAAQAVILSLTGLYFTYNLVSGHITHYIAQKFVWLSWFAAGLLLVLAALRTAALLRGPDHNHHDHNHHDHDHHDHGHHDHGEQPDHPAHIHTHSHAGEIGAWIGLGIVALPVVFGVLVPSQPLGSRAIDGEIASSLSSINAGPGDWIGIAPAERTVLDWQRAFSLAADPGVFAGQEADVIGFVYRDDRFDDSGPRFMLARFIISCCVADAQALGLVVEWPDAPTLHEDRWVRVRGTFEIKEFDGLPVPVLVAHPGAEGVQPVAQPAHPYLYP